MNILIYKNLAFTRDHPKLKPLKHCYFWLTEIILYSNPEVDKLIWRQIVLKLILSRRPKRMKNGKKKNDFIGLSKVFLANSESWHYYSSSSDLQKWDIKIKKKTLKLTIYSISPFNLITFYKSHNLNVFCCINNFNQISQSFIMTNPIRTPLFR